MDTSILFIAAASLVAIFLATRLLAAIHQGWLPSFVGTGAGRQPQSELRAVARLHLTPQHSLHLVESGGRRLLVACSPSGSQLLSRSRAHGPDRAMAVRVGHV